MPTPVAVDGDTKFETSTANVEADTDNAGSWSLTSSSVTLAQTLSVTNKLVELHATATWTYSNGSAGGTPITPIVDSATLNADPTLLTDNGSHILVDENEAAGSVDSGNKIVVSASQSILKTD